MLNPQPGAPDQDALGLITIYTRPDEPISKSTAVHIDRSRFIHHLSAGPLSTAPTPIAAYFSPWSSYHTKLEVVNIFRNGLPVHI